MRANMTNAFVRVLAPALLALAAAPSQAITIGFDPTTQNAAVGSPVGVAIVISDLGDGVAASLFRLRCRYQL
jgi:hypothetical protein